MKACIHENTWVGWGSVTALLLFLTAIFCHIKSQIWYQCIYHVLPHINFLIEHVSSNWFVVFSGKWLPDRLQTDESKPHSWFFQYPLLWNPIWWAVTASTLYSTVDGSRQGVTHNIDQKGSGLPMTSAYKELRIWENIKKLNGQFFFLSGLIPAHRRNHEQ